MTNEPHTAESRPKLQGMGVTRADERALLDALEKAFDYRGDVTIETTDGRAVAGYIFDRRRSETLAASYVRVLPADSDEKVRIAFDEIARLEFTGRDAAHGKTFENWMKRFVEKKLRGERASIESEPLDEE